MNAQGPSIIANLLPIIIIFAIFYFLIIRPQQKQEKERQKMLASLTQGDKVITTGGMHGVIESVSETEVALRIADKVKVTMQRSAIAAVTSNKPVVTTPQGE
ncbi:MAG: preprotein translocase subunit YajC [Elusimicrobiaceae bacterium]